MFRYLRVLLLIGFNQITSIFAKTMCNEDYYGNCIENGCSTWFDGNHTCDIIYDNNTIVNMTCSDVVCKEVSKPVCIKPGYHLNSECRLVYDSYRLLLVVPLVYTIQFLGFIITSIYCAPIQKFSTKLTDINKDIGITCLTCWCPCITFGEIFQDIYDVPQLLGCLVYIFCGSFRCCLSVFNRFGLRKKYNINGEQNKDFLLDVCIHCWGHPCALCQERRELIIQRGDIESSPNIYTPIVPQQTEQPTVMVMASRVGKPVVINASLVDVDNNKE